MNAALVGQLPAVRADSPSGMVARWEYLLLIAVFVGSMTQILFLPPSIHGDGVGYFSYLRSAFFDHDLQFADEYRHFGQFTTMQMIDRGPTRTGLTINIWGVGTAVMWSPFYGAGHLVALASQKLGWAGAADGYSEPYVYAVAVASAVYAFMGLLLAYRLCRRRFSAFPSMLSLLALWFGSSLPAYMYFHPSLSHAVSFFLVAAFFTVWWDARDGPVLRWALMGVLLGLMTATRPQNALYAVPVALYDVRQLLLSRWMWNPARLFGTVRRWMVLSLAAAIAFVPQMGVWWVLYGSLITNPYEEFSGATGFAWASPHVWEVLFSSRHGLISWTPILAPALAGLGWLVVRGSGLARSLAIAFVLQLYLVSAWNIWWQGASFGGRMFIELTPAFALGLAALFSTFRRPVWRLSACCVVALLVIWNLLFILQYGSGLLPVEDEVSWGVVARNQIEMAPAAFFRIVTQRPASLLSMAGIAVAAVAVAGVGRRRGWMR